MEAVNITEAKAELGALCDRVAQGEPIIIRRKAKLFQLIENAIPESTPMRPDGYFDQERDEEEYALISKRGALAPQTPLK